MAHVTRRDFLKWASLSGLGAVAFAACGVPEDALKVQSPVRLPEDLANGFDNWYATTCPQCAAGEGIIVRVVEGRAKKVEGNSDFPVNIGKTSVRCQAAVQEIYHPDRITGPRTQTGGAATSVTWDAALTELQNRLTTNKAAAANVLLITSPLGGQLGAVVSQFARTYGLQHLALEPVDRSVEREAAKRVFGQDVFPFFDVAHAHTVVSFGADFLGTWMSPVMYGRQYGEFRQGAGRTARGTLIQVESRFSMTAANADEWLPVKPGAEGVLALSIAQAIVAANKGDAAGRALLQRVPDLASYAPAQTAAVTGIKAERVNEIAMQMADRGPTVVIAGGNAGAHTNGLFNVMAAYLLNVLLGSVGREGGVLLNPASPLASIPATMAGATGRQWQDAVAKLNAGQTKLVMVYDADPVHDLAGLDFGTALGKAEYVAAFSSFPNDTTLQANVVLPVRHGLESWGSTVSNPGPGYQTVGFQQPVVQPLPGFDSAYSFGDAVLKVASGIGVAMSFESMAKAVEATARELFQRGGGSVQAPDFPTFWVNVLRRGGWWDTNARGQVQVQPAVTLPAKADAQFQGAAGEYPFHLVPFESAAMGAGRGAHLPWLQAAPDPVTTMVWTTWVELSPKAARDAGIKEGDVLTVATPKGSIDAVAYVNPASRDDVIALPLGQGHKENTRYATNRGSNTAALIAPALDTETGALAWGATRAKLTKTGRRIRMSKFEGFVPAIQIEGAPIIQTTKPEAH